VKCTGFFQQFNSVETALLQTSFDYHRFEKDIKLFNEILL